MLLSAFSIGVPVNPINEALGNASLIFLAKPSIKSYWLLWASSAMTIIFFLSESRGYCFPFSSGRNFCIVVNIIPPDATFRSSFILSLDSACFGSCLSNSWHLLKVPNNWSSKSFLSVNSITVGFSNSVCKTNFPA